MLVGWCGTEVSSKYSVFFQAEDGIRDYDVTGVQTCALPIFMTSSLQPRSASLVFFTSIGVFGLIVSAVLLLAACSITRKQNAGVEPVATDPGGSTSANAQVVENRSSQDRASGFQQAARVEVKERGV